MSHHPALLVQLAEFSVRKQVTGLPPGNDEMLADSNIRSLYSASTMPIALCTPQPPEANDG